MYLIQVHDDGDVEVRFATEVPPYSSYVTKATVPEAVAELVDYGCDEEDAETALEETRRSGEWVVV